VSSEREQVVEALGAIAAAVTQLQTALDSMRAAVDANVD